jgi:lipoprotein LprG
LHPFLRILLISSLLPLLTACARPTPPPLPPAEIMAQTVAHMRALKGFSFVIVRTGAPAYIDTANTFSLSRVDGDYVAPDRATGNARVIGPGIVAAIKYISIGEEYWETNYLTGEWWVCPRSQCFNPAILFDPQSGLQPILESDLSDLQRLENAELEELPGKSLYSLTGKLKGEHLFLISWGLIGPQSVNVHLWIDPDTFVVERITLEEPAANGADATLWTVDFLNFNRLVEITPPVQSTPKP